MLDAFGICELKAESWKKVGRISMDWIKFASAMPERISHDSQVIFYVIAINSQDIFSMRSRVHAIAHLHFICSSSCENYSQLIMWNGFAIFYSLKERPPPSTCCILYSEFRRNLNLVVIRAASGDQRSGALDSIAIAMQMKRLAVIIWISIESNFGICRLSAD